MLVGREAFPTTCNAIIDHNEKDRIMYILPECITGIKQKQMKMMPIKTPKEIKL